MPRHLRRPTSTRTWGAAVCAAVLLTACGGPVELDSPDLAGADRAACEGFVADLPGELADQQPREVEPEDALGAAYGDPAITVRCGVGLPEGFSRIGHCEVADGVGWYVADEELDDPGSDATLTAVTFSPHVEVTVPADYRPDGAAAVLVELAEAVRANLRPGQECV